MPLKVSGRSRLESGPVRERSLRGIVRIASGVAERGAGIFVLEADEAEPQSSERRGDALEIEMMFLDVEEQSRTPLRE